MKRETSTFVWKAAKISRNFSRDKNKTSEHPCGVTWCGEGGRGEDKVISLVITRETLHRSYRRGALERSGAAPDLASSKNTSSQLFPARQPRHRSAFAIIWDIKYIDVKIGFKPLSLRAAGREQKYCPFRLKIKLIFWLDLIIVDVMPSDSAGLPVWARHHRLSISIDALSQIKIR